MSSERLKFYCIAIGGTGMAPLAALLQKLGHHVEGSDGPLYPPMSTLLKQVGIQPHVGFDPAHLSPPPDLVIVGNAVPRTNPEAEEVERRQLPRLSMPEALGRFFLRDRQPLVVAGTHGKTTTTSMAAWVWQACGREPGYLIGGVPKNLPASFAIGSGERFILEGDEYNAAYFDRGPKFLHYRPQTLILTNAEHDHIDLYPTPESLLDAYAQLVRLLPEDGRLIACGDWPAVRRIAEQARCPVTFYGLEQENHVRPAGPRETSEAGTSFEIEDPRAGRVAVTLPAWGDHNVTNALGVWAAARLDGIAAEEVARALAAFRGVTRRLEELGSVGQITVIDDFAHHPTAVGETLDALRRRYPARRLVVLYEPRSLTAGRDLLFEAYIRAFSRADRLLLAPVYHAGRLSPGERLDLDGLVRRLATQGVEATACASNDELFETALGEARTGDVITTMSSGSFDEMPHRLLASLATAHSA